MRNDIEGHEAAGGANAVRVGAVREGDDGAPGGPDRPDPEAGLATAEYAVATVAAVGFAGLLIAVLKSDTVRGLLENIISSALSV